MLTEVDGAGTVSPRSHITPIVLAAPLPVGLRWCTACGRRIADREAKEDVNAEETVLGLPILETSMQNSWMSTQKPCSSRAFVGMSNAGATA